VWLVHDNRSNHRPSINRSTSNTLTMGEMSARSDSMALPSGMMVPRQRPRIVGGGSINNNSQREKMSKFREPSFRLLTGTRKLLNGGSSSRLLDNETVEPACGGANGSRGVRFALKKNERITVTNFTTLITHRSELWWTADELAASRADGRLLASTDVDVRGYILSFDRAYKKVLTDKRITSDCLRDLVVGLKKGYRGLEDHALTGSKMTRKSSNIRSYVTAVVKHYRDCIRKQQQQEQMGDSIGSLLHLQLLQRYDSTRSIGSISRQASVVSLMSQGSAGDGGSQRGCGASSIDQSVRNYSKKLSTGSRNFAQAMARAEHLAVGRDSFISRCGSCGSFSVPLNPDERDEVEEDEISVSRQANERTAQSTSKFCIENSF
jgi:hypothetical protein